MVFYNSLVLYLMSDELIEVHLSGITDSWMDDSPFGFLLPQQDGLCGNEIIYSAHVHDDVT